MNVLMFYVYNAFGKKKKKKNKKQACSVSKMVNDHIPVA